MRLTPSTQQQVRELLRFLNQETRLLHGALDAMDCIRAAPDAPAMANALDYVIAQLGPQLEAIENAHQDIASLMGHLAEESPADAPSGNPLGHPLN